MSMFRGTASEGRPRGRTLSIVVDGLYASGHATRTSRQRASAVSHVRLSILARCLRCSRRSFNSQLILEWTSMPRGSLARRTRHESSTQRDSDIRLHGRSPLRAPTARPSDLSPSTARHRRSAPTSTSPSTAVDERQPLPRPGGHHQGQCRVARASRRRRYRDPTVVRGSGDRRQRSRGRRHTRATARSIEPNLLLLARTRTDRAEPRGACLRQVHRPASHGVTSSLSGAFTVRRSVLRNLPRGRLRQGHSPWAVPRLIWIGTVWAQEDGLLSGRSPGSPRGPQPAAVGVGVGVGEAVE